MSYGMTTEGYVPKTYEVIVGELQDEMRAEFGANIDVSENSVLGVLIAVQAEREAEAQEQLQALDSSRDPDNAEDTALDALCALTGTVRYSATYSSVALLIIGQAATEVDSGNVASTSDTEIRFATTEDATLVEATAWAPATVYAIGAIRSNGGNLYYCFDAGTSAGSGGPTSELSSIADGTCIWKFLGNGTAYDSVTALAEDTGPLIAASGTITQVETPVAGWASVYNLLDADLGRNRETNAELRVRRVEELDARASATDDAVRVAVLAVEGVTSCYVFPNEEDTIDADGVPAHSFETVVLGGDGEEIAEAILANKPVGIKAYGDETETLTDSQGFDKVIGYSRPTEKTIYFTVTLTYDEDVYPLDGDDQVAAAVVAFGDTFGMGKDVYASALKAKCFEVAGVLGVTTGYIGTSASPVAETTIANGPRDLAVFDTSRVVVNSSAVAP